MAKAKKPATKKSAGKPATKTSAGKPAASTSAGKPANRSAGKPAAKTSAGKPTTKTSAGKPAASTSAGKPATKTSAGKSATTTSPGNPVKATAVKPRSNQATDEELRQTLRDLIGCFPANPIGGLELLARAWRMRKNVRIAELAELVEMRVPETPEQDLAREMADRRVAALRPAVRSIATVSAVQAVDRLNKIWRDPRTSWLLLDFLAKPPWRSLPAVACYQACLDVIVSIGDPRIAEPLAELGARYSAVIPTSVGLKMEKLFSAAVEQLKKAPPWLELDEACTALCDQIAAMLGPEVAAQQAKQKGARVAYERHAEFLAAIFATPDDDAPRIVYADWLSEIGDSRGELINLQLARAHGRTDEVSRAREYELLELRNAERWLGAIAPVVFDNDQVYARGFTSYVRLWKNKAALQHVVDEPAWGTVETLAIADWSSIREREKVLIDLVCGPRLRNLRALVNFPPRILGLLEERDELAKIERVEAIDLASTDLQPHLARWLAAAKRPRMISFETKQWNEDATELGWLVELPRFDQLERVLLARTQVSPASVARLEATGLPRVAFRTYHDVTIELSRGAASERFDRVRVSRAVPPSWLDGPRATLDGLDTFQDLEPWILDRDVIVDVREPFVPGSVAERRPVRAPATPKLLEQIGELATSVTVEGGWQDMCPEMIWN